jgi:antiphage defense system Thoeris ThsA-like protein
MWGAVSKLKYPSLALLGGLIFIFMSFFQILDLKQLRIERIEPIYAATAIGAILVFLSAALFVLQEDILPIVRLRHTKKLKNGYTARMGTTEIDIEFGRIEEVITTTPHDIVLLAANEFFDDECIDDMRSSLGAFAIAKFGPRLHEFKSLVRSELRRREQLTAQKEKLTYSLVKKNHQGGDAKSYGVGTCLHFSNPLGLPHNLVLAAVTTIRAGQGLRSDISYIQKTVKNIDMMIKDRRIDNVVLPLFGSGHGGLHPELALLTLLISLSSIFRGGGAHPKKVRIIVFQRAPNERPVVSFRAARRSLNLISSLHPPAANVS